MDFRFFVLGVALIGCSLEISAFKTESLSRNGILKTPTTKNVLGWEESEYLIDFILDYFAINWQMYSMLATLDNIEVPQFRLRIPQGPLEGLTVGFNNTNLRGLHKIIRDGFGDVTESPEYPYIVHGTFQFNQLEFHSELTQYENKTGAAIISGRVGAAISNVGVRFSIAYNSTEQYIGKILEMRLQGVPKVELKIRKLGSQFGELPIGGAFMNKMENYIQSKYIPGVLLEIFSEKNIAAINAVTKRLSTLEHQPTEQSDVVRVREEYPDLNYYFYSSILRIQMCNKYAMTAEHTIRFGGVTNGRIELTNGTIRGLNYLRRKECFLTDCPTLQCNGGSLAISHDDLYIDYDVNIRYLGIQYKGNMRITISGVKTKDFYTCDYNSDFCQLYYCIAIPATYRKEIVNRGRAIVDVTGIPYTLIMTHGNMIEFGEGVHEMVLQQLIRNTFFASPAETERCSIDK